MEMMKAYICTRYGQPDVLRLESCKKPVINSNEVLIKVYSTSVTNSDIFIRSSKVNKRLIVPFRIMIGILKPRKKIIGQVYAGIIEQIGESIEKFKVGDKVYGLTGFSLGAYAEYMKLREVPSRQGCISIMPNNVTFEEATAAAYGGLLALQFVEKKTINDGSKVLIYGASSTSGIFAMQYCKHLGAEVTAVCSESKFEFVRSLGADKILDYGNDESIKKLEMYDVVFDCVGKTRQSLLRTACLQRIKDKNDFISIDDEPLLLDSDRLTRITNIVENNSVKLVNDKIYSFDQMVEAHEYVELGHKKGNIAVTVDSTG
jgi:NADPH:quinone reductase-like Zn-dependent oxidoreductase